MTKHWIFLLLAAIFETAWMFSLKLLDFSVLKTLKLSDFFNSVGYTKLMPLLGYIIFGIANTYLFAISIKQIPMATAMAVWMAFSLIFLKISEVVFFEGKYTWSETCFLILITIGIVGLKMVNK